MVNGPDSLAPAECVCVDSRAAPMAKLLHTQAPPNIRVSRENQQHVKKVGERK